MHIAPSCGPTSTNCANPGECYFDFGIFATFSMTTTEPGWTCNVVVEEYYATQPTANFTFGPSFGEVRLQLPEASFDLEKFNFRTESPLRLIGTGLANFVGTNTFVLASEAAKLTFERLYLSASLIVSASAPMPYIKVALEECHVGPSWPFFIFLRKDFVSPVPPVISDLRFSDTVIDFATDPFQSVDFILTSSEVTEVRINGTRGFPSIRARSLISAPSSLSLFISYSEINFTVPLLANTSETPSIFIQDSVLFNFYETKNSLFAPPLPPLLLIFGQFYPRRIRLLQRLY